TTSAAGPSPARGSTLPRRRRPPPLANASTPGRRPPWQRCKAAARRPGSRVAAPAEALGRSHHRRGEGETSVVGVVGGRSQQGSRQAGGAPRGDGDQSCEAAGVAGGGQSCGRRPTSACTGARAARLTWLLRCCRPRPVMRVRWAPRPHWLTSGAALARTLAWFAL